MKRGIFSLLFVALFLSGAEAGVSKEVDLALWGITDPSQIGYLSAGVLHKISGDEIIIYDIRREAPAIKEPRGPRGKTPQFKGNHFLLADFAEGNVNRLGGYFSAFSKQPSECSVSISNSSDGKRALSFLYKQQKPGFSGFWLHLFDFKLPPEQRYYLDASPFTHLTFSIRGANGGEKVFIQAADRVWERKEDSLKIGEVNDFLPSGCIDKSWQRAWVPLEKFPKDINLKELASIVFLGDGSGNVFLGDVAFATEWGANIVIPPAGEVSKKQLNKGMWLWETVKLLQNEASQKELAIFLKKNGFTDIFIQVPHDSSKMDEASAAEWDKKKMKALISKLSAVGVRVHALDGDPRYALARWHGRALATIRSVIDYNKSAAANERFVGVRYDNEPYLLPSYGGVQKQSILNDYISLLAKSKKLAFTASLEFGVDIPFWFDERDEFFERTAEIGGRPVSEIVIDIADNVGILDYRTGAYGADGTVAHAIGEVAYASKKGKKVFVGLETVRLPDETIFEFLRGKGANPLLIEKLEGTKVRLILGGVGGQYSLGEARKTFVPASKITFYNLSVNDLRKVMRDTEFELSGYPAFYGFAIHSYESYYPWLKRQGMEYRED